MISQQIRQNSTHTPSNPNNPPPRPKHQPRRRRYQHRLPHHPSRRNPTNPPRGVPNPQHPTQRPQYPPSLRTRRHKRRGVLARQHMLQLRPISPSFPNMLQKPRRPGREHRFRADNAKTHPSPSPAHLHRRQHPRPPKSHQPLQLRPGHGNPPPNQHQKCRNPPVTRRHNRNRGLEIGEEDGKNLHARCISYFRKKVKIIPRIVNPYARHRIPAAPTIARSPISDCRADKLLRHPPSQSAHER